MIVHFSVLIFGLINVLSMSMASIYYRDISPCLDTVPNDGFLAKWEDGGWSFNYTQTIKSRKKLSNKNLHILRLRARIRSIHMLNHHISKIRLEKNISSKYVLGIHKIDECVTNIENSYTATYGTTANSRAVSEILQNNETD